MGPAIALGVVSVVASGCPPVADLGDYTDTEVTATTTGGGGGPGTQGETGAPTSSGSGEPGSSTGGGESTAGLGGQTEPGDPSGSSSEGTSAGSSSEGTSAGSSSEGTSAGSSASTGDVGACGDMVVAAPEQCDDGNVDEWDGCLTDCTFGPGTKAALGLPDKLGGEEMYWFAGVPAQFIEANTHGLVIGGRVVDYLPDQIAAHVTLVPIPDGGPALWSYLEVAGMYGRVPGPMATAADGSVVMAGQVYTEQQNVDSGGYLWLVRFAADGQVVWSHEFTEIFIKAEDLELTPAGEIVIAGRTNAFTNLAPDVHKFAADGTLSWTYHEPDSLAYTSRYGGVAVDDMGTIYVAGGQFDLDDPMLGRTILRALGPAGALLWAEEHVAPLPRTDVFDLVLSADDVLLLSGTQYAGDPEEAIVIGAFDTTGGSLWWKPWTPLPGWHARAKRLAAAPDGGLYAGGGVYLDGVFKGFVVRLDAQGEPLWSRIEELGVEDLLLAPDGHLYGLTPQAIAQYLP
ncbi:MAG: hypothetical protein JNK56_37740 [Myxococcales bacterium]|nr:hypothetical protein [Myxococcales bacterium]